jgi:hypothetical protein
MLITGAEKSERKTPSVLRQSRNLASSFDAASANSVCDATGDGWPLSKWIGLVAEWTGYREMVARSAESTPNFIVALQYALVYNHPCGW